MSTEARVVAPQQKIGARPPASDASTKGEAPKKSGKKKLIVIGGAVAVVVLVAAYWFLMGPGKAAPAAAAATGPSPTASPAPTYKLGEVMTLDSISINLQGGHYLRLGLGLQLIQGVHTPPDKARALDAAIALYSGHTTEELADPAVREDLKKQLGETLFKLYDGDVVSVYYTDFVTQ